MCILVKTLKHLASYKLWTTCKSKHTQKEDYILNEFQTKIIDRLVASHTVWKVISEIEPLRLFINSLFLRPSTLSVPNSWFQWKLVSQLLKDLFAIQTVSILSFLVPLVLNVDFSLPSIPPATASTAIFKTLWLQQCAIILNRCVTNVRKHLLHRWRNNHLLDSKQMKGRRLMFIYCTRIAWYLGRC